MDRHELGNMIFNLEDKKNLKEVNFTKDAVGEVLGYLKELYEIKDKEHEEDRRVANLEAKLAESENKRKSLEEKVKFLTEETEENFVDGQKYNELKQQLAETEESYNNTMRYLNKTRSELLNLPKKIVEEIRDVLNGNDIEIQDNIYLTDILDIILKKYGGKDE